MEGTILNFDTRGRFAVFALVVLIGSGLVLTLFHEARAASDIYFVDPVPTTAGTFTVDLRIDEGQYVPITDVEAIIEEQSDDFLDSRGKSVVTRAQCEPTLATASSTCTLETSGSKPSGVASITFVNAFGVEDGDDPADSYTLDTIDDFALDCTGMTCTFFDTSYGYDEGAASGPGGGYAGSPEFDDDGFGYGYGYDLVGDPAQADHSAYGYGYATGDLVLRFSVSVSANGLGSGTFYLTFLAHTSSALISTLSSPFAQFTSSPSSGGSGGGSGDGDGDGAQTVTVTATLQADGSYLGRVTADSGDTIVVNFPTDAPVDSIEFTAPIDLTNARVTLMPLGTTPPAGTSASPGAIFSYFTLTITNAAGDSITVGIVTVKFTVDNLGTAQATEVLLMHFENNAWGDEPTTHVAGNQFEAQVSGLSPFAIIADTVKPDVSLAIPAGTLTGTVALKATATDNIRVTKVEFFVDGTKVGTDSSSPFEVQWNSATSPNGEHTIKAVATDVVGHTDEDSKTGTSQNEGAPGEETKPKDGLPGWIWVLIILVVVAVIGGAAWYFSQQKQGGGGQMGGGGGTGGSGRM